MRETRACLSLLIAALPLFAVASLSAADEASPVLVAAGLNADASAGASIDADFPRADADAVLNAEHLRLIAHSKLPALGPLSIGTPDSGLLVNPQRMPDGPYWKVRNPVETYGTEETIDFIVAAIESVEARFPGSPALVIGDISRADGGHLNRHRSHQAGRDVDLGFYYAHGEAADFALGSGRNLDLPRTWTLVRALVTDTDVDRLFVDRSLIAVFYKYARDVEHEDVAWLDDVFGRSPESKGLIQHVRGHKNHLHVRFFNRRAQEYGRLVYPLLVEEGAVPPPRVKHRVRNGETLGSLAARYGTSASAIRAVNGLRGSRLRAGRSYVIPIRRVPEDGGPLVVPPRRLPPASVRTATGAAGAVASADLAEAR